jgi:alginate O-acetyltransferase complex protein AlgI
MVFSSVDFLFLFMPLFLLAYVLVPWKNIIYVAFSLVFYFVGEGWFTAIIVISVAMNFMLGVWIDRARPFVPRRVAILVGVFINLVPLFFFKYVGFSARALLGEPASHWTSSIHLPLGISFFTFHAISYLIDIYRRDARAERSLVNLGLYLLMFPQLISGPILRYHTVAKQLRRRVVTGRHVYYGLVLFCLGMGQKVLLADGLAGICDPLFAQSRNLNTATAWLATVAYTFQIFFDFDGYSNMALGLGWVTGFYLPRNFNYPYVSRSITEFWRRWHMSLSQWFRDYLYIPLGGNRLGPLRTYRNLVTVFLLCGLWHGAAWTFVLWGIYHGVFLVIERIGLDRLLRCMPRPVQHGYAILVVMFGWVLFRAHGIRQAARIVRTMILPTASGVGIWQVLHGEEIAVLAASILFSVPLIPRLLRGLAVVPNMPPWPREMPTWSYCAGALCALAILAASAVKIISGSYSPFIYYRF